MPSRFSPGDTVYAKDGRSYVVEIVDGGTIYCASSNGAETEFPAAALMTEAEWGSRADGRRDASFNHLKQSRVYTTAAPKLDIALCTQMLSKAERLTAGLLDFAAYTAAERILAEQHDQSLAEDLSIKKCRALFDAAKPEVQATILANVLNMPADTLVGGAKLGDNLILAMIEKGLAGHGDAYEEFQDRPRR